MGGALVETKGASKELRLSAQDGSNPRKMAPEKVDVQSNSLPPRSGLYKQHLCIFGAYNPQLYRSQF